MSGRPTRRAALLVVLLLALAAGGLAIPGTAGAFSARVTDSTNVAKAAARFTCANTFAATSNRTNAYFEYALTQNFATANDSSGNGNTGNLQPSGAHPVGTADATTACPNDTAGPYYYAPNGTTSWISTTTSVGASPATFSLAAWLRTTAAGGYVIGLNAAQDATSSVYDRHVYIDTAGRPVFGTYSGVAQVVTGPSPVNDGRWHQVVATFSAGTGMALWVDGAKVATNATYTTAEANTGWWTIGYGRLSGWPAAPASTYFSGDLRFVAAYKAVLSDAEIAAQYGNGVPGP